MSVKSDALEMGRKRKRTVGLTAALAKLEGKPDGTAATPPVEHLVPTTNTLITTTPHQPARVVGGKKPWEDRPGHQCRPLTSRERQQQDDDIFDAKAIAQWNKYIELCQLDADENASAELFRLKRMANEKRTGMRPLPDGRDHCSLVEAARRGLIGNSDED